MMQHATLAGAWRALARALTLVAAALQLAPGVCNAALSTPNDASCKRLQCLRHALLQTMQTAQTEELRLRVACSCVLLTAVFAIAVLVLDVLGHRGSAAFRRCQICQDVCAPYTKALLCALRRRRLLLLLPRPPSPSASRPSCPHVSSSFKAEVAP